MNSRTQINTDVLVAGGGMAGVCAALAAARNGVKVVLCQDRPVLGGNASSEVCMHICGADAEGYRGIEFETEVREGGIIEEIRLDCMALNPDFSHSMFDLILYDKCRNEDNLTLMLNTALVGAESDNGVIRSASAIRTSTEEEFEISADIFIDCTGDGRLGFEAGAEFMQGRESKHEFKESMALEQRDNLHLGCSLLFRARDTGKPSHFIAPKWAREFNEDDLALRDHSFYDFGYWWLEYGGCLDSIKDTEIVRDELLAILMGVWDHIKNSGNHPESENWVLDWFGFIPGKRESRRFIGKHILSQNELTDAVDFEDSVAHGGWSLDTHPPQGIYAKGKEPCSQPYTDHVYSIPLSCCISKNVDNLLFAGRNISTTHIAFASTRVMATCAVLGEGVGTLAAMCIKKEYDISQAHNNSQIIERLQQQLLRQDVYIPGRILKDRFVYKGQLVNTISANRAFENSQEVKYRENHVEEDILLDMTVNAEVCCSSEQTGGEARNILDGYNRSDHGLSGARNELTLPGKHRWMSDPGDNKPWIKLNWTDPVDIRKLVLVFDTGMHRPLMMSYKRQVLEKMHKGCQPETIKDFKIYADCGKGEKVFLEVQDNYQRLREFECELYNVVSLRLEVHNTNGLDHARLFDIRCY